LGQLGVPDHALGPDAAMHARRSLLDVPAGSAYPDSRAAGLVRAALAGRTAGRTVGSGLSMPPRFPGLTYPCPCCGSVAQILRLSQADLRHAGYTIFGRDLYFKIWSA